MVKKSKMFLLFSLFVLCFFFLSSCGDTREVVKDGITYQRRTQIVDGKSTEGYYVAGCDDNIEILNIAETINGLPVLGLGREAFKNKTNLKEVTIPNTINNIGIGGAPFLGCTNIEKLTLAADDVEMLFKKYGSADANNINPLPESLKKIYLTSGCEKISSMSFRYCRYLEELHIPSSVVEIDDGTGGITIGVNGHTPSGDEFDNLPFLACENLTIFCETSTKPSGWDDYWNYINMSTQATVVWGDYSGEKNSIEKKAEKLLAVINSESISSYYSGTTINITKTGAVQLGFNGDRGGFRWDLDECEFTIYCRYRVVFYNLSFLSVDELEPLSLRLDWNDTSHNFLKYYNTNTKYFDELNKNYRNLYFDFTSYDEYIIDFRFNHYNITAATFKNLYFSFGGLKSGSTLTFDSVKIYYSEL